MTNASTAHRREPFDAQEWMRAAGAGDAERLKSLLDAGADVNAALEGGDTALIRATSKGHLHVVRMLLAAGADPNAEREDGMGALTLAVFFGYADIVRALLAGGADPSAKGRLGTTAEKWARLSGFDEIADMLSVRDPDGAQGSTERPATNTQASTQAMGAAMFFPTEGTFSPVVPLSKINEALESSDRPSSLDELESPDRLESSDSIRLESSDSISTAGQQAEVVESVSVRDAAVEPATDEQEDTLVPLRAGHATRTPALKTTRPKSIPRPKGVRRTWPVTAIALALSVIAGLIAGTYLIGFRQSMMTPRPAPLAEDAAPAAVDAAPGTDVATQVPEPRSTKATATSDPQASQLAPQSPAPSRPASVSESRHAPVEEPPARSVKNADARLERPARTPSGQRDMPATKPAQRDATTTAHRAKVAEERSPTPAPPKQSFPVSSPPPSARSRKVIQWP
jgi:hypothetical protein